MPHKTLAILGSTGSIGTQAIEVIKNHPDTFKVHTLTAGNNVKLLIQQARELKPLVVVIGNSNHYSRLKEALSDLPIEVKAGQAAIADSVTAAEIDVVLTAMVGFSGLLPTIQAIKAGKNIALANKETLVVAGELITSLAQKNKVQILPVDSEHSAIFQCLVGEKENPIEKLILTASGGPFRGKDKKYLAKVTKAQALKHPNWEMGAKITIDSATLMNKGLEVIEAKWLFNTAPSQIDVVVHPQSIVHSLVQFQDGSIKAQLGLPDMKLPIQYALGYPKRLPANFERFSFANYSQLTFELPDMETFGNLALAFEALKRGGNSPCILNAANEVAVSLFLQEKISFLQIAEINEHCLQKIAFIQQPNLDDYLATDEETRHFASNFA